MTDPSSRAAAELVASAPMMGGATPEPRAREKLKGSFPLVELRLYRLHPGKRDELIELFEREFVESQEEQGMKVIGTFIDLDRPDRFVWLRGYSDMASRLAGLTAFYGGPVWQANRAAANATMIDSDNVFLLRSFGGVGEFELPPSRPAAGADAPAGLVTATIYHLKSPQAGAAKLFEEQVRPGLEAAGIQLLATFTPEESPNNFPPLPVREGEAVLIWFAAFADEADHVAHQSAIDHAAKLFAPLLSGDPELLRLQPTARSLIRATQPSSGLHDFDFLHGSWNVTHRRLKARGVGSTDWQEYSGTAETRPLLAGLCNIEEHRIEGQPFSGVALRCFDRAAKQWQIYWVSERDGLLQPPVHGKFAQGTGLFEGDDVDGGRPIRVRFLWRRITPASARWEQSFSYDAGKTWETNWIMDFERSGR
jgi:quinol monooxygenase YgiN